MTDLDLDALEATARAVNTPGPWEARCDGYKEPSRVCHDSEAVIYLGYDYWADFMGGDAEHIAAFDPPTVLTLIAKLREAEAVIAEALELIATVKVAGEVPVDVFAIERILARSKPTNQEGES